MGEVLPLPHRGDVFLDPRGEGRSLRVSGHRGAATVVLSIWRQGECRATFRLSAGEVDEFIRALLNAAPPSAPSTDLPAVVGETALPPVFEVQLSGNVVVELNTKAVADVDQAATVGEEPVATGDVFSAGPDSAGPDSADQDSADSAEPPAPEPAGDDSPGRRPGPDAAD